MSNNSTTTNTKTDGNKALRTVLKWAVIADLLWAAVIATLNAVFVSGLGNATDAGAVTTVLGVILTWIVSFIIGFLQGAIFLVVIGGFIVAGFLIFGGGNKKDKTGS